MGNKIGVLGLGKMGHALVMNLIDHKIDVVVYNRDQAKETELIAYGAIGSTSLAQFVEKSRGDDGIARIWLMISANAMDDVLFGTTDSLTNLVHAGDILIDGGNSYYQDTKRRSDMLAQKDIQYIDCGTSGGISGARHGACLMIGGDEKTVHNLDWLFSSVAQKDGYQYLGKSGSGHYVKMVHNAVEYGMMQSIAEGLDLLENGAMESLGNTLDLRKVLSVWNHGSIVTSYLTQITQKALEEDPHLEKISGYSEDNGEGAWTILEAIKANIPFLTVAHALFMRYISRKDDSFAMKIIAAQRNQFGGHSVKEK